MAFSLFSQEVELFVLVLVCWYLRFLFEFVLLFSKLKVKEIIIVLFFYVIVILTISAVFYCVFNL